MSELYPLPSNLKKKKKILRYSFTKNLINYVFELEQNTLCNKKKVNVLVSKTVKVENIAPFFFLESVVQLILYDPM